MNKIDNETFKNSLTYLFKETFEGSREEGSVYLDKGVGVFNAVEKLDADGASKAISGGSIAAHTEHLRYYLEVLNNFLNGRVQIADWSRSWNVKTVNTDEWNTIKNDLKDTFKAVNKSFEEKTEWNQDSISQAMAIVTHSAYHFGAIRQIAKTIGDLEISVAGEQ